jgi:hypothetical protein
MLSIALLGCKGDDTGPGGAINGEWRLSSVSINVDGNVVTQIVPAGKKASFSGSNFTYTNNGQREGTYSLNEEETELSVTFESNTIIYPITSISNTEIVFTVKSIDLSGNSFTVEEEQVFILANQSLNLSGKNWESVSSNGQLATVNFTLKIQ